MLLIQLTTFAAVATLAYTYYYVALSVWKDTRDQTAGNEGRDSLTIALMIAQPLALINVLSSPDMARNSNAMRASKYMARRLFSFVAVFALAFMLVRGGLYDTYRPWIIAYFVAGAVIVILSVIIAMQKNANT